MITTNHIHKYSKGVNNLRKRYFEYRVSSKLVHKIFKMECVRQSMILENSILLKYNTRKSKKISYLLLTHDPLKKVLLLIIQYNVRNTR